MPIITATFHGALGPLQSDVQIDHAVIAGWTGRDKAAVEKHIVELEAVGVKRPATTPIFYRVSANRITTDQMVEAVGTASSGEVEFVLLQSGERLWVGVGSDHTDREVEAYGVTVSKQMCDKPIAAEFWPFDDAAPHWDSLILRAFIQEGGNRVLYQEGTVNAMIAPGELIKLYTGADQLAENTIMFCGTFAAKGGIRPSDRFEYEIEDPIKGRKISSHYTISTLPILG